MKKSLFKIIIFLFSFKACAIDLYFATAADEQFYSHVLNLVALIHRYHFDRLKEVAIFDLGLTAYQRSFLNSMDKVTVYDVEMVHPDLLTPFIVRKNGKRARGWYAWKPVILKQALDMFPYVLYIDAGIVINGPLDPLFEHIIKTGYLFVDCTHSVRNRITTKTKNYFELDKPENAYLLDKIGIAAGFQGVSRTIYDEYVKPMYELAHHLEYFEDDGTAVMGFGEARHDQVIASIFVNKLGYKILGNFIDCIHHLDTFNGSVYFVLNNYVTFWGRIHMASNLRFIHFRGKKYQLRPLKINTAANKKSIISSKKYVKKESEYA